MEIAQHLTSESDRRETAKANMAFPGMVLRLLAADFRLPVAFRTAIIPILEPELHRNVTTILSMLLFPVAPESNDYDADCSMK